MQSKEGVIWCWKMDTDNILFIFREKGKEIEIDLTLVNTSTLTINRKMLIREEKTFLMNLKNEIL